MSSEQRFTLEPYTGMSSRYHCPYCNHKDRKFSRYIDTETGEYLANHVGRCERIDSCGTHYKPKQYFEDNEDQIWKSKFEENGEVTRAKGTLNKFSEKIREVKTKSTSYIPANALKQSLKGYEQNSFVKYLISLFGQDATSLLISRYFIGSSRHWEGSTVFWQLDGQGKIRTGKIMLYNPSTGKRIKEPYNHITWAHKALKLPEFTLKQCFFGEHLLKDKTKPVAIVESEKTAIIASQYLPQFIWLAVGSLTNLSRKRCLVLLNRDVVLFPDLNGFEKWKEKANQLPGFNSLTVSDLLERKATDAERKKGLDLADYLVKYDYQGFILPEPEATKDIEDNSVTSPVPKVPLVERVGNKEKEKPLFDEEYLPPFGDYGTEGRVRIATNPEQKIKGIPTVTASEIEEIEAFFNGSLLPSGPAKLDKATIIMNVPLFVRSHLATIKTNQGSRLATPYFDRLKLLKEMIIKSKNN